MISLKKITKKYFDGIVLNNVSIDINKGEVLSIIGPSGAGKSTLLRCIINLERVDEGSIYINNENIVSIENGYAKSKKLRKICGNIGMVFQKYNLFPHLTVLENVVIPQVVVKKVNRKIAIKKAESLLEKVGVIDQKDKYPQNISGGQQQRVAIARALALDPKIMLFDEPTSALDPELVKEVLIVMKRLANEGMTIVIVTHDLLFAKKVSDKVAFLEKGKEISVGKPQEILLNPNNNRIKKFLGDYSI